MDSSQQEALGRQEAQSSPQEGSQVHRARELPVPSPLQESIM